MQHIPDNESWNDLDNSFIFSHKSRSFGMLFCLNAFRTLTMFFIWTVKKKKIPSALALAIHLEKDKRNEKDNFLKINVENYKYRLTAWHKKFQKCFISLDFLTKNEQISSEKWEADVLSYN